VVDGFLLLSYFRRNVVRETDSMNSTVCNERIRLYLNFAFILASTMMLFFAGGRALADHHRYRNEELGMQLGMHIDAKKEFFGGRRLSLVEDYNVAEHGFNCSISKGYRHRSGAERAMTRHAANHATLSLHYRGSSCMKFKDWEVLSMEADGFFTFGCFYIVVSLVMLAGCIAYERERWRILHHSPAAVPTTEEETKEPPGCHGEPATWV
jgi:hypothetical protein